MARFDVQMSEPRGAPDYQTPVASNAAQFKAEQGVIANQNRLIEQAVDIGVDVAVDQRKKQLLGDFDAQLESIKQDALGSLANPAALDELSSTYEGIKAQQAQGKITSQQAALRRERAINQFVNRFPVLAGEARKLDRAKFGDDPTGAEYQQAIQGQLGGSINTPQGKLQARQERQLELFNRLRNNPDTAWMVEQHRMPDGDYNLDALEQTFHDITVAEKLQQAETKEQVEISLEAVSKVNAAANQVLFEEMVGLANAADTSKEGLQAFEASKLNAIALLEKSDTQILGMIGKFNGDRDTQATLNKYLEDNKSKKEFIKNLEPSQVIAVDKALKGASNNIKLTAIEQAPQLMQVREVVGDAGLQALLAADAQLAQDVSNIARQGIQNLVNFGSTNPKDVERIAMTERSNYLMGRKQLDNVPEEYKPTVVRSAYNNVNNIIKDSSKNVSDSDLQRLPRLTADITQNVTGTNQVERAKILQLYVDSALPSHIAELEKRGMAPEAQQVRYAALEGMRNVLANPQGGVVQRLNTILDRYPGYSLEYDVDGMRFGIKKVSNKLGQGEGLFAVGYLGLGATNVPGVIPSNEQQELNLLISDLNKSTQGIMKYAGASRSLKDLEGSMIVMHELQTAGMNFDHLEVKNGMAPEIYRPVSDDFRVRNAGKLKNPSADFVTPNNIGSLFDQIAKGEGTSKEHAQKYGYESEYDITLGYGAYDPKGFDKPISKMTLGELKEFQRGMLRNPKNKLNSSAVGKYQIVGKTLRALQAEMDLGDDVVFSPEIQDQMAINLLVGRGLEDYQNGKITKEQFQNNLAKEWASIATTKGRSHYGQAVGTTSEEIQAILDALLDNADNIE